MMLEF